MAYSVVDIIDKGINCAVKRKNIFEKIAKEKSDIANLDIMSRVLIKQVDNTIKYYEKLKKEANEDEFEEIDFVVYDKISFLINEFNKKIYMPEINNVREYLKFSLDLHKELYSLVINIQGRLVKNLNTSETKTYKILSDIISNIDHYIVTLEKILK